jgi:hypothetical protein
VESCYEFDRLLGMRVEVVTYSGYSADERPLRFTIKGVTREVVTVRDRWYGPDDLWFRVEADDGGTYILRYRLAEDCWTMESFTVL